MNWSAMFAWLTIVALFHCLIFGNDKSNSRSNRYLGYSVIALIIFGSLCALFWGCT